MKTKSIFIIVGLVSAFISLPALAKRCDISGVARCICPASMSVICERGGGSGSVRNEEIPPKIYMTMVDKTTGRSEVVVLNNSTVGVRDYYGPTSSLLKNPEIVAQFSAAGFSVPFLNSVDLQIRSIVFNDDVTLYEDHNATKPVAVGGGNVERAIDCNWTEAPLISVDSSCNKGVCAGAAYCKERATGDTAIYTVYCRPDSATSCPSANACVDDSDTTIKAFEAEVSTSSGSAKGTSLSPTGVSQ